MRWVILVLLLLVVALQYRLWFGEGGMRQVWQLERDVAEQQEENRRLATRNAQLATEVEDLKEGREAVEERARVELGMTKPGEIYYQVIEPPVADATNSADDPSP